ncbi:MAG: fasciclin domain-containing protein [Pseudomonadota bacterium]
MTRQRTFLGATLLAAAALIAQPVLAGHHEKGEMAAAEMQEATTIVDVAAAAGSFETLIAALNATDLTDVLRGEGPFTVLAPTDEAFAALPEGALESLLAEPAKLADILKLHVVPGRAEAAQVLQLAAVDTVQGKSLDVATTDGVMIGGAKVVKTDIPASNGVIHVIDRVILP